MVSNRFFANYRNGKCTVQVIGKHKLSKMPERVATFLQLPNPKRYTGHSLRRSSASCGANAGVSAERLQRMGQWKSSKVAERYIEESLQYKQETGEIIAKALRGSKSAVISSDIVASQGYKDFIDDDSDFDGKFIADGNALDTCIASQGYKELAVDDLQLSLDDISTIDKTLDRSAIKEITNENFHIPSTSKMDYSKFCFNNCNVSFNMK